MELTNEFTVDVPVERVWDALVDLERIAPCMPGVQLLEVEGDEYRGQVKVKVGPMVAQYKGVASFEARDPEARRAVIRAEGRDARGQGTASAVVTASLADADGGTHVTIHTDLKLTGKVAQFGRGVLADVSAKLLREFVASLESEVFAGAAPEAAAAGEAEGVSEAARGLAGAPGGGPSQGTVAAEEPRTPSTSGVPSTSGEPNTSSVRRVASAEPEPVDLVAAAGGSVLKRFGPVLLIAAVAAAALWLVLSR